MTINKVDTPYRLHLRVIAKLMITVGALAVAYVFIAALISGEDDEDSLELMRVSIADIEPGQSKTLTWDGRPVLVYHRTPEQIAALKQVNEALRDERSVDSVQPEAATNALRSTSEPWFVSIALGTDYGCPLEVRGEFIVDTCRGSRYDLAGRVFKDGYADRNLIVPRYTIDDTGTLLLGR